MASETKALVRYGASLTIGDLLLLELPHLPERTRERVLWEFTGYPCWWPGNDHPINVLRQQLREWRDGEVAHV